MIFEVDGFDIVPYIINEGVEWDANPVDGPDAGRVLNADMERDLLCYKASANISCVWMPKEKAELLYDKIMPEFINVRTDTIPWIHGVTTKRMYTGTIHSKMLDEYSDGTKVYGDVSFPLTEK